MQWKSALDFIIPCTDRIEFILLEVTRIWYCLKSKFCPALPDEMTPPFKEFYGIRFCDEF